MEDVFFTKLREIQKKERANSALARVGPDFYERTYKYLDEVKELARKDPFSADHDLLKNIQRIATEICEIREHKIADAAIMNIHRSYHLFQGKPQFDLLDTTPLNLTNEEEKLYFSLVDTLKNHRGSISFDELQIDENEINFDEVNKDNDSKIDINADTSKNTNKGSENTSDSTFDNTSEKITENNTNTDDKVLNKLNQIKSAKIIEDEKYEDINKQINKSNQLNQKSTNLESTNLESINSESSNIESNNQKSHSQKPIESSGIKSNNEDYNSVLKNVESKTIKDMGDKKSQNSDTKLANIMRNDDEQFVNLDELKMEEKIIDEDYINDNIDNISKIHNISKSTSEKIANVMILIFSEINSIVGVDKKVYGPFKPQDIVVMPDINADILIKNRKGRLIKI